MNTKILFIEVLPPTSFHANRINAVSEIVETKAYPAATTIQEKDSLGITGRTNKTLKIVVIPKNSKELLSFRYLPLD